MLKSHSERKITLNVLFSFSYHWNEVVLQFIFQSLHVYLEEPEAKFCPFQSLWYNRHWFQEGQVLALYNFGVWNTISASNEINSKSTYGRLGL